MTASVLAAIWPNRTIDLLNLRPEDVDWYEIAATLARLPRFGGRTRPDEPVYSVAQHSVRVMDMTRGPARSYALLHDAHEWAIGDLLTPTVDAADALSVTPGAVSTAVTRVIERIDCPSQRR